MRFEHNDYFWKTIFLNSRAIDKTHHFGLINSITRSTYRMEIKFEGFGYLIFSLCDPLDTSQYVDGSNLFSNLAGNFEGVVQYNKDNRAFEVQSNLICLYIIILTCEILHYFML